MIFNQWFDKLISPQTYDFEISNALDCRGGQPLLYK